MKRWIYSVLSILMVVAIVYVVYRYRVELGLVHPQETQESTGAEQTASNLPPAPIVWKPVDRTPEGFKVEMPAGASQFQIPAYNLRGGAEQVDMIQASPGSQTTFAIAWADDPPVERFAGRSEDRTLDSARDGALARTQTTLTYESRNRRLGYPACDFSAGNGSGGILNARLILAGSRLYMLIAAFPGANARREEDVSRFFDSFRLVSSARTSD